jgi:microcystin-dependent protein
MATGFFRWSRTPADNANATYTWAEGQAPSSVNDSARGIMSDAAQWRDDISGAIVTGGSSTAYTIASYQGFTTLALMANQMIAFTPHTTNGATVTLNVDGLGAKPLRSAPSTELLAGTLIQGTPYLALYNNSDAAWYLQGFFGNPYNIPLAGGLDYWGTTAPNSSFVFPFGQAISRTTYSALFALMGTTFGVGDGSTTFNLPDRRGRVSAGKDDMGGSSANRLTAADDGLNGDTLGAAGGGETQVLVTANLPAYTPTGSLSGITSTATGIPSGQSLSSAPVTGGSRNVSDWGAGTATIGQITSTGTFVGVAQGGTSTAFGIVQPTIICNYIIRII